MGDPQWFAAERPAGLPFPSFRHGNGTIVAIADEDAFLPTNLWQPSLGAQETSDQSWHISHGGDCIARLRGKQEIQA